MADLIDITLKQAFRIDGQIVTIGSTAQVAQCLADDLILRNKATLTKNEPAKAKSKRNSDSDGGQ